MTRLSAFTVLVLLAGAIAALVLLPGATARGALGLSRLADTRVEVGAFPKKLFGPTGEAQTLHAPPRRIVSLMLGADEILTALVEPERIAAVTRLAEQSAVSTCAERIPQHAARIFGLDPERILSLEPDMVFAAGYTLEFAVRMLTATGVPVVRLGRYVSFEDVERNIVTVGAAVGRERRAGELIAEMRRRLRAVALRTAGRKPPRVLYYSPIGYTDGAGTLVDEKIRRASGRNVVAEAGIRGSRNLAVDMLIALDPEVIVVPRWSPTGPTDADALLESRAWRNVQAVRRRRVHAVDAKWLTSVSQDGVRGVEVMAEVFHPEAFR